MLDMFRSDIENLEKAIINNNIKKIEKYIHSADVNKVKDYDFFMKLMEIALKNKGTEAFRVFYEKSLKNVVIEAAILNLLPKMIKERMDIIDFFLENSSDINSLGQKGSILHTLSLYSVEKGDLELYLHVVNFVDADNGFCIRTLFQTAKIHNYNFVIKLLKHEPTRQFFEEEDPEMYQGFYDEFLKREKIKNF
jgi:hypothetical protein